MRPVVFMTAAILLAGPVAVCGAEAQAFAAERHYVLEPASCTVTVEGTSTMHGWEAKAREIRGELAVNETDRALLASRPAASPQALSPAAHIEIPVRALTSGKDTMDKNMWLTLKSQDYPVIDYKLASAEIVPFQNGEAGRVRLRTKGLLAVAGKSREIEIPMELQSLPNGGLKVTGETSLKMSDFGINPPKFMMGMLRVGNDVRVRWTCVLVPAGKGDTS